MFLIRQLSLSLLAVGVLAAADLVKFPAVGGQDLHGESVEFPAAFRTNRCTLVIVAFSRKQQEIIDPWLPELVELAKGTKGFEFFELPTIKPMNRVMRWIIHNGMRSGVTESAARSRTVTLHIDKAPFNAALGIVDEATIYQLLVDEDGKVLHRESGVYDKAKFERIRKRVLGVAGESSSGPGRK